MTARYQPEPPLKGFFSPVRQLTREEHPKLYEFIDHVSAELGLSGIEFHMIPKPESPTPDIEVVHGPNAMATADGKKVFFTEELLDIVGHIKDGNPNFEGELSEGFKGILAHEMDHLTKVTRLKTYQKAPGLVTPAVLMTGLYLYERSHKHATQNGKDKPGMGDIEHANQELAAEINTSTASDDNKKLSHGLLRAGKYVAAALAGMAIGTQITKYGMMSEEFLADSCGARFVEDKQAFADTLKKMDERVQHIIEHSDIPGYKKAMIRFFDYHPSVERREANILR